MHFAIPRTLPLFYKSILAAATEKQIEKAEANMKYGCVSARWGKLAISKAPIVETKRRVYAADVFLKKM